MTSEKAVKTDVHYIGLDLGTTNSALCVTQFDTGLKKFDEPTAVRLGQGPIARSLLLLSADGQSVKTFGEQVYADPDYWEHPERVQEEFKLRLGSDDQSARSTRLLARRLLDGLRRLLNIPGELPREGYLTTVGVPASWLTTDLEKARLTLQAVKDAGFPAVEAVAEPVGAMLYHAYRGDILFKSQPQDWLVVDIGGGTTDCVVVRTQPGGNQPEILDTFSMQLGGKNFDRVLLEKLFLARYWQGAPPNAHQQLELLRAVRKFKEGFSEQIARNRIQHSAPLQIDGQSALVKLTRQEFESEAIAQAEINKLESTLLGVFKSGKSSLKQIERVILTGGGARWYFMASLVRSVVGSEPIVSDNPEQTIAKGLALARTGFRPAQAAATEIHVPSDDLIAVEAKPSLDGLKLADAPDAASLNLAQCRQQAESIIQKYTIGGSLFALLVSPLPGVSQIPLTAAEAKLVVEIAKVYRFNLKSEDALTLIAGLIAGGTLLKAGVMEAATFVPGIGYVLKAGVAAVAIAALGKTAITFFESRRGVMPRPAATAR